MARGLQLQLHSSAWTLAVFQKGARAFPSRGDPDRTTLYERGCPAPLPRPSGGSSTTTLQDTSAKMDEHVLVTMVSEVGQEFSPTYDLQVVRNSNWKIIWRSSTGTERHIHTWCYRCSFGVVVCPSGLLPDRVTHRCPLREGEEDATRLPYRTGSPSSDGEVSDWENWVIRDEGGEEESEGSKLWLPVRDVS